MPRKDDWLIRALDPTKPHLVVTEGREDVLALRRIAAEMGRTDVLIGQVEGKDRKFTENLRAIVTLSGFQHIVRSLVVIGDADEDPDRAFAAISEALEEASREVADINVLPPKRLGVFSSGMPKVGVFLWPNCRSPGCLESLCLGSVAGDGRIRCVTQYLRCTRQAGGPAVGTVSQRQKARAHAFMAATADPRAGVGAGFDRRRSVWDMNHRVWEPIKEFLRQL